LFNSEKKAGDKNVANEAAEFLKNNDAAIKITTKGDGRIRYTGNGMSIIAESLSEALALAKELKPNELTPVYVMLKRYRLLPDVFKKMKEENDNGLIPMSPEHSQKVMNFKRDMVSMNSYFNVISDVNNMNQDG